MIRLSKSVISNEEKVAVSGVLDQEYLGMGSETKLFEEDLENYLGNSVYVVCVNTGTSALHLALQSLGFKKGSEIIVPTLTYLASYQAITAAGLVPISCDVDFKTGLIDLQKAKKLISLKTVGIMPVHYAGFPGNLKYLYDFAHTHSLRVVEDAAHAFGTKYNGGLIGSQGDVVCFSFDGIKNITSGEGGAIVSSSLDVINRARDIRLLGVIKDTENRYKGKRSWDFEVVEQGWRCHMSNIMAAIGRVQLKRFESSLKVKRMLLHKEYRSLLIKNDSVGLFDTDLENVVPHIMPITIKKGNRDEIRHKLLDYGIETGIHYKPNHLLSYFKPKRRRSFNVSDLLYEQIMTLPLHPDLSIEEVNFICDNLKKITEGK